MGSLTILHPTLTSNEALVPRPPLLQEVQNAMAPIGEPGRLAAAYGCGPSDPTVSKLLNSTGDAIGKKLPYLQRWYEACLHSIPSLDKFLRVAAVAAHERAATRPASRLMVIDDSASSDSSTDSSSDIHSGSGG